MTTEQAAAFDTLTTTLKAERHEIIEALINQIGISRVVADLIVACADTRDQLEPCRYPPEVNRVWLNIIQSLRAVKTQANRLD